MRRPPSPGPSGHPLPQAGEGKALSPLPLAGEGPGERARALRTSLASIAALLLSACGFHLAGGAPLPDTLKKVRIDTVATYRVSEPPLEAALRARLQRRGAQIIEKERDGLTVIRLTELKEARQVLSVGADGKAQEYQLITRVTYDVQRDGKPWLPPDQIEARQDYSFNAQQVLAKEQEAERLREYLQDELAELLLLKLEAAAARVVPPGSPPGVVPPVTP